MPKVVIFYIDALIDTELEKIFATAVLPTILIIKHNVHAHEINTKLKEILETSNNVTFQNLSPEVLAAKLDIDYNSLLDLYLYLAERFSKMKPYVAYTLERLKRLSIRIIVYTYSDPTWDQTKLTALGLERYIDQIISIPLEDLSENATIYTLLDILIKRKIIRDESEALLITTDIRDFIVANELNLKAYLLGPKEGISVNRTLLDIRELLEII